MKGEHQNSHKPCCECSKEKPHGPKLRFYREGGAMKAKFVPSQLYTGYEGLVHGGTISFLLDEVMGIAAGYEQDRLCFAAELNIRFLSPLPIDKKVTLIGQRVADKKKLWLTQGEIRDDGGHIYARAWGKYFPLSDYKKNKIEDKLNISLTIPKKFY